MCRLASGLRRRGGVGPGRDALLEGRAAGGVECAEVVKDGAAHRERRDAGLQEGAAGLGDLAVLDELMDADDVVVHGDPGGGVLLRSRGRHARRVQVHGLFGLGVQMAAVPAAVAAAARRTRSVSCGAG